MLLGRPIQNRGDILDLVPVPVLVLVLVGRIDG